MRAAAPTRERGPDLRGPYKLFFRGGAIFPGYRLMAKALNDYTATLPLVENLTDPDPPVPSGFTGR